MHIFDIVRSVLLCLALGLFVGATAAIGARVFGIEPAPPGVVGALVGVLAAALIVRRQSEA
jgi:energy-converting hydrogenase Eha subunit A